MDAVTLCASSLSSLSLYEQAAAGSYGDLQQSCESSDSPKAVQ